MAALFLAFLTRKYSGCYKLQAFFAKKRACRWSR